MVSVLQSIIWGQLLRNGVYLEMIHQDIGDIAQNYMSLKQLQM